MFGICEKGEICVEKLKWISEKSEILNVREQILSLSSEFRVFGQVFPNNSKISLPNYTKIQILSVFTKILV